MKSNFRFWLSILAIWILATCIDRLWWNQYTGIPAWDQADYLNSALDHARAFELVEGGKWEGFKSLLDLSPKIPPLGSIVNGIILAIAGDEPRDAAWSLSIWHGILLIGVAGWSRNLHSQKLGVIATGLVAVAPVLVELRTNYVLEIPLVAGVTWAIWQLGNWNDPFKGGKWKQVFIASALSTAAILIKQSALLVLLPAIIWTGFLAISNNSKRRWQFLAGLSIGACGILPWLKHNWITTLGGTNRAVLESAAIEGDPSIYSLENWTWYPSLLPQQLSAIILGLGLSGILIWVFKRSKIIRQGSNLVIDNRFAWKWLLINLFFGWLFTSLIPNKDPRYITPLIVPLLICLGRGWLELILSIESNISRRSIRSIILTLIVGLFATVPIQRINNLSKTIELEESNKWPLIKIIEALDGANPESPQKTVIVVPSTPDLNQHNVTYYGRRNGGNLVGRQLGSSYNDIEPVLNQAEWILLAEGDQGSVRESALVLDQAIRTSKFFYEIKRFPRENGNTYSLWHRLPSHPIKIDFKKNFPVLAQELGNGTKGIEYIFNEIAIQHMLDGHFSYREPVRNQALKELEINSDNTHARWTLVLLAILENRPSEADKHLSKLEELLKDNEWPSIYRAIVNIADWNPWKAKITSDAASQRNDSYILLALADLTGVMSGLVWELPEALKSIPIAIEEIERSI